MRVQSIALCLSIAASLVACAEEEASIIIRDAGPDAGADAGRDGGSSPTGLGGMDAGIPAAKLPVESDGTWTVFPVDSGTPNPTEDIQGLVTATAVDGGMQVTLEVDQLPADARFGTHLHQLPCDQMQGGGHYQHDPAPTGAASDPKYANPKNEVWLDFVTDIEGNGFAQSVVNWVPRKGGANSVVVHERVTEDGGIAGARLACTNLPFTQ